MVYSTKYVVTVESLRIDETRVSRTKIEKSETLALKMRVHDHDRE